MSNLLSDLLIKSAKLYPEKPAVRYKNSEISYRNLNLLSDKLSSLLISKGIKKNDRVAIYLDKSIDAIIAIFGPLKSGACYVPLDPMAPPERQSYIINDCSINYLITSSKKIVQIQHILEDKTSLRFIIFMDMTKDEYKQCYGEVTIPGLDIAFKDDILGSNLDKLKRNINEDNLAYIVYTSGSTGRPKGVMISYAASLAFIDWAYTRFNVKSSDNVSACSPFHFDISIFDIFVTMKAAATLCIVPQGLSAFPRSLADFIEKEKISIWYSVPSILIQLVLYGSLEKRDLSCLKQILFAGEVFPVKYLRKLMQLVPCARYYNLYGPTETNVCTFYPVMNIPEFDRTVPIGKPCKGIEVFVLDDAGNTVKDGEVGELYVSGPTLMQGYWNDPLKTKEVLLESFLPLYRNQKVYKTGDLVKVNRDGNLEFQGRKDNMIKSRGYRIELEEIESVLYEHPAIKELVIIAVPDDKIGNKIKVAIVLKNHCSIYEQEVRLFCSKKLPNYMIPEIITFNEFFPKTSTGKIDRTRLI